MTSRGDFEVGNCGYLSIADIYEILPIELREEYQNRAAIHFLNVHQKTYVRCIGYDCNQIFSHGSLLESQAKTMVSCDCCGEWFCLYCKGAHKASDKCMEGNNQIKGDLKKIFGSDGIATCKECGTWILKFEGCNHMTCTVCLSHFCFICEKSFPEFKGMKHLEYKSEIYDHINTCKGNI